VTTRALIAAGGATVVLWTVSLLLPRDFLVGQFVDDAHYAVLAKAVREGRGYHTINLPDAPAETKYPPGFPLLLSALWDSERPDRENLDRLRWANLILVGPLAGALTLFAVEVLGLPALLAGMLAVAGLAAPGVLALWTIPLSGPLFLLLAILGLTLAAAERPGWAMTVLMGAVYVRTVAVAFLLGVVSQARRARRPGWKRDGVVAVAGVLPWVAWQAWHAGAVPAFLRGMYGSYGRWYLDSLIADPVTVLFRVPARNAIEILSGLGGLLLDVSGIPVTMKFGAGALLVWGLWRMRRRAPGLAIGLALYGGIVLLWPFPPGRFLAAIWPVVLIAVAASIGRFARGALVALAVAVAALGLMTGRGLRQHEARGRAGRALVARLTGEIGPHAVLASTNPAFHYLWFGVPSVPVQRMRSYRWYRLGFWSTAWGLADDLWPIVDRYGVTHVVVEARGVEGRYAAGSLQGRCPGVLIPRWEVDRTLLFRVDGSKPCRPPPSVR